MKIVRNVYDFVTGGSIAAPVGLLVAVLAAALVASRGATGTAAIVLLALLAVTFVAATLERAR